MAAWQHAAVRQAGRQAGTGEGEAPAEDAVGTSHREISTRLTLNLYTYRADCRNLPAISAFL
jgi:hypothetical protein